MRSKISMLIVVPTILTLVLLGFFKPPTVLSKDKDFRGWEINSDYQKYYDASKYTSFKGTVEKFIDVVPLPDMAVGAGMLVRTKKGKRIMVHLGPKSFVDISVIGLKKGDHVKCMGVYAIVNKKPVFIASKVKKGEYIQIKLRKTANGVPFWAMSLEELSQFTAELAPPGGFKPGITPRFYSIGQPDPHSPMQLDQQILEDRIPTEN